MVFPTQVGVILMTTEQEFKKNCIPHASGGDP